MKLSVIGQKFLIDLVDVLRSDQCHPVFLRNYEDLPCEMGNDIDIFVARESLGIATMRMFEKVSQLGGRVVHGIRRSYVVSYWIELPGQDGFIHIDYCHGALSWKGFLFLNEREFLSDVRPAVVGFIPRPAHEALISLMTSLLWGGFVKEKYIAKAQLLLSDACEFKEFQRCLDEAFGRKWVFLNAGDFERACRYRPSTFFLRFQLVLRSLASHRFGALSECARYWSYETRLTFFDYPSIEVEVPVSAYGEGLKVAVQRQFAGLMRVVLLGDLGNGFICRRFQVINHRRRNFLILVPGSRWSVPSGVKVIKGVESLREAVLSFLSERVGWRASRTEFPVISK